MDGEKYSTLELLFAFFRFLRQAPRQGKISTTEKDARDLSTTFYIPSRNTSLTRSLHTDSTWWQEVLASPSAPDSSIGPGRRNWTSYRPLHELVSTSPLDISIIAMSGRIPLASAFRSLTLRGEAQSCSSSVLLRRPFSSTSRCQAISKDGQANYDRELESRLLGGQPKTTAAPSRLAALSQTTRSQAATSKNAQTTEEVLSRVSNLIKNPYRPAEPPHHIHVFSHRRNTHVTLTRPNCEPILSLSAGNIGFRKGHRGGYEAAHQLSVYVMDKIQERGLLMQINRLEVVFQGFGQGREAFTKVLLGKEGRMLRDRVIRVSDSTKLKFGGTRSPRARRLG
ncbi:mitochondrial ribosomal protein subunit S18 [Arthroderma uncinatum]|uniref:mitochondrial ribosomal protein subunit S18 n=1 Tax=Arthroderma uncinatum TaxID=74035 RepID=UPI00144AF579|nr:mitochondrial ribosomal protein subunit S18 [Arthroderma uncinatum]KAF3481504.1 mitochondrial ribosomal protein subunit S18 [Arthroderma uncinatum]